MSIQNLAGPTRLTDRAVVPDVARGLMLLLIAVSNVPAYLFATAMTPSGYPITDSLVDRVIMFIHIELIVHRSWPLFAFLFGYGMTQLWRARTDAGAPESRVRSLLRRRGLWLLVFGFAHAVLLWAGDILGAYGMIAIAFSTVLLRGGSRRLLTIAGGSLGVVAVGGVLMNTAVPPGQRSPLPSTGQTDVLLAVPERLVDWLPTLLLQPLGMVGAVGLGVLAARYRLLEEPWRHIPTLRRVAIGGLSVSVLGALPMATQLSGWWKDPSATTAAMAGALHFVSGYGGIGYAAAIALAVVGWGKGGRFSRALAAGGQRSLSCYLFQSLAFVALLASYGGGLGAGMGVTTATAIAVAVWAASMLLAELLRRAGNRGPAEIALRALTRDRIAGPR